MFTFKTIFIRAGLNLVDSCWLQITAVVLVNIQTSLSNTSKSVSIT